MSRPGGQQTRPQAGGRAAVGAVAGQPSLHAHVVWLHARGVTLARTRGVVGRAPDFQELFPPGQSVPAGGRTLPDRLLAGPLARLLIQARSFGL